MVVVLIAILVMNHFFRPKSAANKLFSYKYVFTDIAVRISATVTRFQNQFVAILKNKRLTRMVGEARTGAETRSIVPASPNVNLSSTLRAMAVNTLGSTTHRAVVALCDRAWMFSKSHATSVAGHIRKGNTPSFTSSDCTFKSCFFRYDSSFASRHLTSVSIIGGRWKVRDMGHVELVRL